jgi:hypothetical protein
MAKCEYRSRCAKDADITEANDHNRDFHYKNPCVVKNEKGSFINHIINRLTVGEDEKERYVCPAHNCDKRYSSRKGMTRHIETCLKVNWVPDLTTAGLQAASMPSPIPRTASAPSPDAQVNKNSSSSSHSDIQASHQPKDSKRPATVMEDTSPVEAPTMDAEADISQPSVTSDPQGLFWNPMNGLHSQTLNQPSWSLPPRSPILKESLTNLTGLS